MPRVADGTAVGYLPALTPSHSAKNCLFAYQAGIPEQLRLLTEVELLIDGVLRPSARGANSRATPPRSPLKGGWCCEIRCRLFLSASPQLCVKVAPPKIAPRPPILEVCCSPQGWGIGGIFSRWGVPVCVPAQAGQRIMVTPALDCLL